MGYRWSEVRILSPRPTTSTEYGAPICNLTSGVPPHQDRETSMRDAGDTRKKIHRIIIADDESLIRLDLREMLSHLGYDVIAEAGDGQTAIDLALKLRPDLVVMDIKMPDLDGIAAAERLTSER